MLQAVKLEESRNKYRFFLAKQQSITNISRQIRL